MHSVPPFSKANTSTSTPRSSRSATWLMMKVSEITGNAPTTNATLRLALGFGTVKLLDCSTYFGDISHLHLRIKRKGQYAAREACRFRQVGRLVAQEMISGLPVNRGGVVDHRLY